MIVSDIYSECRRITGYADQSLNYSCISEAVECLANKGLIDAMQGYLEVPVTSDRVVTLPRDVETPIKVNVGDNPSFGRTKLYEFSMNGPGSNYSPTDWAWEDRGTVPVLVQPASYDGVDTVPTYISLASSNAGDVSVVTIRGRTLAVDPDTIGQEVEEDILLAGTTQSALSVNPYYTITKVIKSHTLGNVTISSVVGGGGGGPIDEGEEDVSYIPLSVYAPGETEPEYKQIRLSQSGTTAHILFRRSVYRVSTMNDWIPVQSRMGLLLMLRANEHFKKSQAADLQTAALLEKQAEKFVEEEQKSRNAFAEVASQTETDSSHGLNINNRDSIIVADIYDEASSICGTIGKSKVFDRITDAVDMLSNKGQWDALEGYVDITMDDDSSSVFTLPRYVETIMAINIGNGPSMARNRWFEFHLNGPGSSCPPCNSWEDHGSSVVLSDLSEAQGFIYKPDSSSDNGKLLTIYGYDSNDKWTELVLVGSSAYGFANVTTQKIKRIERITRQETAGFAQLIAYNYDGTESTQLGYYYPDETEPNYRRVKLPCSTSWIRVRYRKRASKVSALSDNLNLKSRNAILAMIGSIEALRRDKPDAQMSDMLEKKALQWLSEEKMAKNPTGQWQFQFNTQTSMASPEHGQY